MRQEMCASAGWRVGSGSRWWWWSREVVEDAATAAASPSTAAAAAGWSGWSAGPRRCVRPSVAPVWYVEGPRLRVEGAQVEDRLAREAEGEGERSARVSAQEGTGAGEEGCEGASKR